ncbi:uncharacterized protein LOC119475178 [Sebastes umbrosus]|uniref:uncharacterized protein LOC119475178 n=1 Tax=Sebastes umbrosus TaxID=72105 RepID=UPI00189CAA68|nr:uncharacterized protein LOC119475178 [Sebastes umbrosus]
MNGFVFLLYYIVILGALLCGAQTTPGTTNDNVTSITSNYSTAPASEASPPADPTSVASSVASTVSPTTVSPSPGPQPTTTTTTSSTTPIAVFYKKECLPVYMVAGGLIIACAILLLSTLFLMCKVCQLSKRVKMLSDNADLISTSEYWMGTAKRNKSASETEVKETTVLMADIAQTQEEMGNGTTKEEGGNKDGPTGEEKEVGDAAKSEEASNVTVAENASKPQEEAADSQSTKAVAASTANGKEEPKDVV